MKLSEWQSSGIGRRDAVARVVAEDIQAGRLKLELIPDRHRRIGGGMTGEGQPYCVSYMFGHLIVAESRSSYCTDDDYSVTLLGEDRAMMDAALGIETIRPV